VDVDDVLVESLPGYLEDFRRYFGRTVKIEEAAWEIFNRYADISGKQVLDFFANLEASDFLATRPVYPEAIAAMHRLAHLGHRLFVVTGRPMAH
jgi:phosphoglycolate phosphatase-like HAD superfamily hydrolase